jgi:hypothetical protein
MRFEKLIKIKQTRIKKKDGQNKKNNLKGWSTNLEE